jgi:hypothetical protein
MNRDRLLVAFSDSPGGLPISSLGGLCDLGKDAESLAALELLCHYTPELDLESGKWKVVGIGRGAQILAAIENYAVSTGKKIFRLAAALSAIPAHEHPTEAELTQALEMSHGRYQLMPNAMIRKHH